MSTIAIAKPNSEAKYNLIIIEGDSDKETITGILQEHYVEEGKINALFDEGKNIVSLSSTIEETVYSETPSQLIEEMDIRESEITVCDYNFLYTSQTGWMIRKFEEDCYIPI
jgi:hypothetical protein